MRKGRRIVMVWLSALMLVFGGQGEVAAAPEFDFDQAVIYFLLTDRFYDGDPSNNDPNGEAYDQEHPETYHGGDFQGLIDKLDYLEELGVNTIWITPIVDNIDFDQRHSKEGAQYGYHGYWAKDFTQLDEHLGDLDTFKQLIDEVHDRDMKLMVDVVLNHTGYGLKTTDEGNDQSGNPIPNFPTEEDQARFEGMLRLDPDANHPVTGELAGLPDFITEDPAVREQIIQWQTDWIEKTRTDRGDSIDYFRVDTIKHVEMETWQAFHARLREIDPDFRIIGEYFDATFLANGKFLESGTMDSLLDFGFKDIAQEFLRGRIDSAERQLVNRNQTLTQEATMGQFLSSHDENGFLVTRAKKDPGLMKAAISLQLTAKGQPVIYYGEELGLSGMNARDMDKGQFSENRYDMDWNLVGKSDYEAHYKRLLSARQAFSETFARGTRTVLGGGDDEGYTLFERSHEGETVLVAINIDPEEKHIKIENPLQYGKHELDNLVLYDYYSGRAYAVKEGEDLDLTLSANSDGGTLILSLIDKSQVPETAVSSEAGGLPVGGIVVGSAILIIVILAAINRKKNKQQRTSDETDI